MGKATGTAIRGCVIGIAGDAAIALGVTLATGGQFYLGAGTLAAGCITGATAAALDSVQPGSGIGVETLDSAWDSYEIYTKYLR